MSKKLKKTVEAAFHSAGKTVDNVKKQIKHYSTKKTARPQYRIVRGRLGATYLVVTCASCGKDVGKRPLTDQAFKPGNTEARDKALTFLVQCEFCGLYVCRKNCWTEEGICQNCSNLKNKE